MPTLYIIRGASGSGKTTYAQWLQDEGRIYDYHEADRYFQNPFLGTPYKFDPSKLKDAHAWCQKCVENDMKLYRHVAVSNTFTKLWEMEHYIKLAKKYGYDIIVKHMTGEYQNVHGVPSEKVQSMRDGYEKSEYET